MGLLHMVGTITLGPNALLCPYSDFEISGLLLVLWALACPSMV